MPPDPDLAAVGRRTPAKGVHATSGGSTLVWITVCARDRGDWCAQSSVQRALHALWSDPAQAWLVGDYLIMPDHLHFFASPAAGPWVELERWTAHWKRGFAKEINQPAWRWQRGLFHHRLRSEREYTDKSVYMRGNPVRAGLVANPEDWPWQGRIHDLHW